MRLNRTEQSQGDFYRALQNSPNSWTANLVEGARLLARKPEAVFALQEAALLAVLSFIVYLLGAPSSGGLLAVIPVFRVTRRAGIEAGILIALLATVLFSFIVHATTASGHWLQDAIIRFGSLAFLAFLVEGMVDRLKHSTSVAVHDTLTGALNRLGFSEALELQINRSLAEQTSLTVAVIDLDQFKSLNDLYGHGFGDNVLKSLVACVSPALANGGAIGRTGGDEFLVFVPETKDHADAALRRSLSRFSDSTVVLGHKASFSYGLASLAEDGITSEKLLEVADADMYRRKGAQALTRAS